MKRRCFILAAPGTVAAVLLSPATAATPGGLPVMEVWKDPNCGCCADWIQRVARDGFQLRVHDTGNTQARKRLGLPLTYGSCHTAEIAGYVIEGHVNPREIRRLLAERPKAIGLAVPGMPVGSPGMDGPAYGQRKDPYDVLLVLPDGSSRVHQSYHRG